MGLVQTAQQTEVSILSLDESGLKDHGCELKNSILIKSTEIPLLSFLMNLAILSQKALFNPLNKTTICTQMNLAAFAPTNYLHAPDKNGTTNV